MNEAESRVQQELVAIVDVLRGLTGLTSRWSGEVELSHDARAFGRKSFSCRIVLKQNRIARQAIRATTMAEVTLATRELDQWADDHPDDLGIIDAYEVLENMKEIAEEQYAGRSREARAEVAA